MSNIINTNVSTVERLNNITVSKSSIKDAQLPARTKLIIDGYEVKLGELVLIKDNDPGHNGVYRLKRLGSKGFLLTKQSDLTNYTSVFVYCNFGAVNAKSWFSMIRRTRNKSMIEFERIEGPTAYPIRTVTNEGDQTEMELSEDTNALVRAQSVISEDQFRDVLSKVVSSKESLMPVSPFEPISPLDKLTIASLANTPQPEFKSSGPLIIPKEEDVQANDSEEMKIKEEVEKAVEAKKETIIELKAIQSTRVNRDYQSLSNQISGVMAIINGIQDRLDLLEYCIKDIETRLANCSVKI
jgi:hypothetical protein